MSGEGGEDLLRILSRITKYLLPPITRDVAMRSAITEEQSISRAQYLDLVYSQFGMLYDLIP